jgi:drug/metabolite transporter (DMT)-like permease
VTGQALALVVGAAVLHSVWNALAKRARIPVVFLWWSVTLASLAFLPLGAWLVWRQGLPAAALPFVAATTALHVVYFYALGRAYRHGDFSRVYPMSRGLGVAVVPVIGYAAFGEAVSPLGAAGIALVVLGVIALQRVPGAATGSGSAPSSAATGWAVLTGLTIAAYSVVDKGGVARLNPVPYLVLLGLGSSAGLAPVAVRQPGGLRAEWAVNGRRILVASAMNLSAYLLVLFAFRLSKVGYVVAARELSIVFSAVIGSWWLGEGRLGARLAGAAVILAGVACVALAR